VSREALVELAGAAARSRSRAAAVPSHLTEKALPRAESAVGIADASLGA